jgi:hypothetical protein
MDKTDRFCPRRAPQHFAASMVGARRAASAWSFRSTRPPTTFALVLMCDDRAPIESRNGFAVLHSITALRVQLPPGAHGREDRTVERLDRMC